MIGKIYLSKVEYYSLAQQATMIKVRPVLVIGQADTLDYIVLPISRVKQSKHINKDYDIRMDPPNYPLLGLKSKCYIRTHKQFYIHAQSLLKQTGNLKDDYPDCYIDVLTKVETFQNTILDKAI